MSILSNYMFKGDFQEKFNCWFMLWAKWWFEIEAGTTWPEASRWSWQKHCCRKPDAMRSVSFALKKSSNEQRSLKRDIFFTVFPHARCTTYFFTFCIWGNIDPTFFDWMMMTFFCVYGLNNSFFCNKPAARLASGLVIAT